MKNRYWVDRSRKELISAVRMFEAFIDHLKWAEVKGEISKEDLDEVKKAFEPIEKDFVVFIGILTKTLDKKENEAEIVEKKEVDL